jgi:hypothetical protein
MDDIVLGRGKKGRTVDVLQANGTLQKSVPFDFNPVEFSNAACGYAIVGQVPEKNWYRVSMQSLSPFRYTTDLVLKNTPIYVDDICRDGSEFVGIDIQTVEIYKINHRNSFTKFSSYRPENRPREAKFCLMDGREMLLVVVPEDNAVHIVDRMDGGRFVRWLDTGSVKLNQPSRICTDYDKHVWIGCHGGKVVVVDL